MAPGILREILPLTVFEVRRLGQDAGALIPGSLAVTFCVLDADHYLVGYLACPRGTAITPDIGHDHRSVSDVELGAMVLTDSNPLAEAECASEKLDGFPNIWVDESRDDRYIRNRFVGPHG